MSVYAEIPETDVFFSSRSDAIHWQSLSEETKQKALEQATQILDASFDWNGIPVSEDQPLRWPRKNVLDLDGFPVDPELIPRKVRIAAMEQALFLTDPVRTLKSNGIKNASVGKMSLSLTIPAEETVAPAAVALLRGLGTLRSGGSAFAKCGTLVRG